MSGSFAIDGLLQVSDNPTLLPFGVRGFYKLLAETSSLCALSRQAISVGTGAVLAYLQ